MEPEDFDEDFDYDDYYSQEWAIDLVNSMFDEDDFDDLEEDEDDAKI